MKVDALLERKVEPKAVTIAEDASARLPPLAACRSHTILNGDSERVVFAFPGEGMAMTRIVVSTIISCPIEDVFDYVTTPANWPHWHPASRAVSGPADHSLMVGEEVTEEFVAGGWEGSCVWRVTKRESPNLWAITTSTSQVRADITYRLTQEGEGTGFERELTYATSGLWFGILDFLLMRRRMNSESCTAIEQLKKQLEVPPMTI
jgi:uncharacterized protein YndB with AHSA1/START domain